MISVKIGLPIVYSICSFRYTFVVVSKVNMKNIKNGESSAAASVCVHKRGFQCVSNNSILNFQIKSLCE